MPMINKALILRHNRVAKYTNYLAAVIFVLKWPLHINSEDIFCCSKNVSFQIKIKIIDFNLYI